jgi:hypothetical protein
MRYQIKTFIGSKDAEVNKWLDENADRIWSVKCMTEVSNLGNWITILYETKE